MNTAKQNDALIRVPHAGAEVLLPPATIISNWLATLPGHANDAPAGIPPIGSEWPEQGGIYAGLMRGSDGHPDYHLIVATGPDAEIEEIKWGEAGEQVPGADSEWDGLANTNALCASENDPAAAVWAAGTLRNGFRDWYLAARREYALCYATVPELFQKSGYYWSSTQYSAYGAWTQDFANGFQDGGHKHYAFRARAVRRFISTSTL